MPYNKRSLNSQRAFHVGALIETYPYLKEGLRGALLNVINDGVGGINLI